MIPRGASTSSAYEEGAEMPSLTADVHGLLTREEVETFNPSSSVTFRHHVLPHELEEVRTLHTEWFPVDYNEDFFRSITNDPDVVTVLAELKNSRFSKIVGLATIGIRRKEKRYNFDGDLLPHLGLASDDHTISYIFTLGVVDELRKRGLASVLLAECVRRVEATDPTCPVIFLHVIEYNRAAMRLYEKNGFKEFKTEPQFYKLGEVWYSGVMFYRPLTAAVSAIDRIAEWMKRKFASY